MLEKIFKLLCRLLGFHIPFDYNSCENLFYYIAISNHGAIVNGFVEDNPHVIPFTIEELIKEFPD